MALYGVREFPPLLDHTPVLERPSSEAVTLPNTELLHMLYEVDDTAMLELIPPALHPTLPPSITFLLWRCPESPAGPFSLAQSRIGCRAGTRPRGLLLGSYCDSPAAIDWLRGGWGYNCRLGEIALKRSYDRIVGSVRVDGHSVLELGLYNPQTISGADVQYAANLNLVGMPVDGEIRPRLVQVDPEFVFHSAERGRPVLEVFEAEAWSASGVKPVYPVSVTFARGDLSLPRLRFVIDPRLPALEGTVVIGKESA